MLRAYLATVLSLFTLACASGSTDAPPDVQLDPDIGVRDVAREPDLGADLQAADLVHDVSQPDQMTPDLPPPDLPACEADELAFRDRCYSARQQTGMSYSEAEGLCAQYGARVASIVDAATDKMVFQQLLPSDTQAAFIGLVRQGAGFVWADGSASTYRHWASGEPNNEVGNEDCVVMWGMGISIAGLRGLWNDAPCDGTSRNTVVCVRAR